MSSIATAANEIQRHIEQPSSSHRGPTTGTSDLERVRPRCGAKIKMKNNEICKVQVLLDDDPQVNEPFKQFLNSQDLIVNKVVPFRLLKDLCRDTNHFITEISIIDNYVGWSKLGNFLYSNKQAAVLRSPKRKTDLVILTNTLGENWTLEKSEVITAIYIKKIEQDGVQRDLSKSLTAPTYSLLLDSGIDRDWKAVVDLLMFPEELSLVIKRNDIKFKVIGSSGLAQMLRDALKSSKSTSTSNLPSIDPSSSSSTTTSTTTAASSSFASDSSDSSSLLSLSPLAVSLNETKTIIMVDRSGDHLYPLKSERHATDTMIFQFGSNEPTEPIVPPSVAYPKNTGGYITTDFRNILMDPDILDKMVTYATMRNKAMLGTWKPILHIESLSHIKRSGTGNKAQNAISRILFWLSSNDIGIYENWAETNDHTKWKTMTVDWFDTIARKYSNEHEAFLFVDNGPNNPPWHHHYPAIDFVNSDALLL